MENNVNVNTNEENTESVYEAPVYDSGKAYKAASADDSKAARSRRRTAKAVRHHTKFGNSFMYRLMVEKGGALFLLAFLIPAAIMVFALAQHGIYPFGERQILVVDLWHQYYPFFRVVREKLLTGGSFFFSWENGMGSNFLSLISYYAMSPLNWIAVLFSEEHVREALTFILVMKVGFSGAFFSCFLRYTFRRKDFSIVFFSVMYALCAYTLGYYWNVMWFDTIALFPLVMLGIVAICRERKWKTFTFALALSLISNYYIGFFTCIFSIFMFAASGIIESKGIKDWFCKFWIMLRSSVLGLALGGFILIPAYCGLGTTYSDDNRGLIGKFKYIFDKDNEFYESWIDILANTISYNEPTKVEGLPNIACGMLALVLLGVFLFSFKVKVREKISVVVMLTLIIVSCNFNKLNYIWHGFHFTNQIPYRFAFIFSFVLVAAAFRAYDVIMRHGIKIPHLALMLTAPAGVFVLNYFADGKTFRFEGALKSSVIITAAYWLIFLAAKVFPFRRTGARNTFLSLALAAAVFSEFTLNARTGVGEVGTTGRNDYPSKYEEITSLLNSAEKAEGDNFYRAEITTNYTLNDSALYGYRGISQFSSAANVSVTKLCKRFGLYASEAGNRFYYRTSTPVFNSMFGIKYLINKSRSFGGDDFATEYSGKADVVYMYENKYPLSLGYMMNTDILELPDENGANPFEYQNSLLKLATGIDESVFTARNASSVRYEKMEGTRYGYGNYSYRNDDEGIQGEATYTFEGVDGASLYGYASCTSDCVNYFKVKYGNKVIDDGDIISKYALVFPMGSISSEDESSVELKTKSDKVSGNYKLMVYAMNHSLFEEMYQSFADEQLEIESFSDTEITGTVTAKKNGLLFLSIPYEKGWRVYVDGKKTATHSVLNAMLGVKVPSGTHEIRLEYVPEGFPTGIVLTTSSAVLIGVTIWFEERRKKRKSAAAAIQEERPIFSDEPDYSEENKSEIYNQDTENAPAASDEASGNNEAEEASGKDTETENEKPEGNNSIQGD